MSFGTFSYPMPANEPVLQYAPGSKERDALQKALAELKKKEIDIRKIGDDIYLDQMLTMR